MPTKAWQLEWEYITSKLEEIAKPLYLWVPLSNRKYSGSSMQNAEHGTVMATKYSFCHVYFTLPKWVKCFVILCIILNVVILQLQHIATTYYLWFQEVCIGYPYDDVSIAQVTLICITLSHRGSHVHNPTVLKCNGGVSRIHVCNQINCLQLRWHAQTGQNNHLFCISLSHRGSHVYTTPTVLKCNKGVSRSHVYAIR